MNQFVAPQFIDVEDRIIGPITTRQFVMMIIGGVLVFVAYKILDTSGFIMIALIVAIAVVVFGFVKINGRRFHEFIGSMIEVIKRPRIRVWYKYVSISEVMEKTQQKKSDNVRTEFRPRKKVSPKRLKDLALIVDTGGKYQV